MAITDPTTTPPPAPPQSHVARDTALAAVAASVLPPAGAVALGLSVTEIAQMTGKLLLALRGFQGARQKAMVDDLTREALHEAPTLGSVVNDAIQRELSYELTFLNKQTDRVSAALGPALAISDPAQRDAAVRQIFETERRYTHMREMAMRVRVMADVRHWHLKQASPEGAYWLLGANVKQHTLDCVAMANHFWPWSVLDSFQPPAHHGCACNLITLDKAIGYGLMSPGDVPDPAVAAADATERLRAAAAAMRAGQVTEAELESFIEEAPWSRRYPKGTRNAGRFRPREGGDPGAAIVKRMGRRGKILGKLAATGEWQHVGGRYVHVPHANAWQASIGGVRYASLPGTTRVHRQPFEPPVTDVARTRVLADDVRGELRDRSRRGGVPLSPGDGPDAVLTMRERGYVLHRASLAGLGKRKLSFRNRVTGALASAIVDRRGKVESTEFDPTPIPEQRSTAAGRAPRTWGEHVADAMAWGRELGKRYDAPVILKSVKSVDAIEDHAGQHDFDGQTLLGRDAPVDIKRAGFKRAAGRALSDDEKRGVYSTFWATAHEIGHGVNQIAPLDYQGKHAALEEALTEELSHHLARERLHAQGQDDVVKWADDNPDALAVRGAYRKERGALADILDSGGVTNPARRLAMLETLKFQTDPAKRFEVLGALLHRTHSGWSKRTSEQSARDAMTEGGSEPRAVLPQSPGWKQWFDQNNPLAHPEKPKPQPKAPPAPPVVIGGDVPAPDEQGPIPSFAHIPLELRGRSYSFGAGTQKARGPDDADWLVQEHDGDKDHVASELLANAVYRALGVDVPVMGSVTTPGAPDFTQVPDTPLDEPPLPKTYRQSAGVILRGADGRVTLVAPRGGYGNYDHTWPKGGVEYGETTQQSALRELWEETGLHAHITDYVGDAKGDTGSTRYYQGVLTGGTPTVSDETEAVLSVKPKKAAELFNRQRDRDVLAELLKLPKPKGAYPDNFPPIVPGVGLAYPQPEGKKHDIKTPNTALSRDFMADALIGNWDFLGRWGDNARWTDENHVTRVNHATAFEYAPGGATKDYGPVPSDVWTILRRGQGQGIINLSETEMREQANHIANTLTPARIKKLVNAAPFKDPEMQASIRENLAERVKWMRQFADGTIDLPQPAEGAEARALHEDTQAKFTIYPEEHAAIAAYIGGNSGVSEYLQGDRKTKPAESVQQLTKRLDGVLNDARTDADSYAFIGFDGDPSKLAGQTVKQKSYTALSTEPGGVASKTLVRVMVPGGSHAWYMDDQEPGSPDVLLQRSARLKFTGTHTDTEGRVVADAMLLPYVSPDVIYRAPYVPTPYKAPSGEAPWANAKPKRVFNKNEAVVLNGLPGIVRATSGLSYVVEMEDGKRYTVPPESLSRPGETMKSPGTWPVERRLAYQRYVNNSHAVNAFLRADDPVVRGMIREQHPDVEGWAQEIEDGLASEATGQEREVHRGGVLLTHAPKVGGVISDEGFSNTTEDPAVARGFTANHGGYTLHIVVPKGTQAGRSNDLPVLRGAFGHEKEWVLQRRLPMRVSAVDGKDVFVTVEPAVATSDANAVRFAEPLVESWDAWDQERHRQTSLNLAFDASRGDLSWRLHGFGKGLYVPRTGRVHTWRTEAEDGAPWHQHVLDELVKSGGLDAGEPVHAVMIDPNGWVAYSSLMTAAGGHVDARMLSTRQKALDDPLVRAQVVYSRSAEERAVLERFAEKLPALNAYPPLSHPPVSEGAYPQWWRDLDNFTWDAKGVDESVVHDVAGELRDSHGRWSKDAGAQRDVAAMRIRELGFKVDPPGPDSKITPEQASILADTLADAVKQYPILLSSPAKPMTNVVFLSATTRMAAEIRDSDDWREGVLAANGTMHGQPFSVLMINDLFAQAQDAYPDENPLSKATQSSYGGVVWHELGHALARASGEDQGFDQTADHRRYFDRYGLGFEDAKAVSDYAMSMPPEAMGEWSAVWNVDGGRFRDSVPAATREKIGRMFEDLKKLAPADVRPKDPDPFADIFGLLRGDVDISPDALKRIRAAVEENLAANDWVAPNPIPEAVLPDLDADDE